MVALVAVLALMALPRLLGYEMLTVHSGSMGETVPVGSLVVARPLSPDQARVGDIVLLVRRQSDGVTTPGVLHRIIDLSERGGEIVIRTKGDANPLPDPSPSVLSAETVTPVLVVPLAGRAFAFARTPVGWMTIVALPATCLLWLQLKAIWFPRRRRPIALPTRQAPSNVAA